MIGMVAAVSRNGIIGSQNKLPFNYPEDMKHFQQLTAASTVIMGLNTFNSIGKSLPKRRNIVITSKNIAAEGVETYKNLHSAIGSANDHAFPSIWLIGGFRIYQEGMAYVDELHLTLTPDIIDNANATYFPWISPLHFQIKEMRRLNPIDDTLIYAKYERTIGNTIFAKKHFEKL